MNLLKTLFLSGAALFSAVSCVYVDENLGQNFTPANQIYEVRTAVFPLTEVRHGFSDSLSAYSSSRMTIGAVRDDLFGLTKRSAAFTLVPVLDTIDVGTNPVVTQFHLTAVRDTLSVSDRSQIGINQNINVYELPFRLDSIYRYTPDLNDAMFAGSPRITKGVPVYTGGDSLSFDFTDAFAQKIVDIFKEDPDVQLDLTAYLNRAPGIYISADEPYGNGGRINMFEVPIEVTSSYYVTGNYAELKLKSTYDGRQTDTSFLFYFGPAERTENTEQYAFNVCQHQTRTLYENGIVPDNRTIFIEGGGGLKPVIDAAEIRRRLEDELASHGLDKDEVIINKATVTLKYCEPDDYDNFYLLPTMLSPTCKFSYDIGIYNTTGSPVRYVTYAGLTDASVSTEDQGDINRSLGEYAPDISHHAQEILRAHPDSIAKGNYDIWLLIMAEEIVESSSSTSSELNDYYRNLAYASYYNNLYGGYGYGYGYGYDSYSYYNNYYNYMLAAMYASSSEETKETSTQLDKDRYYFGAIHGPGALDESLRPTFSVVYSYISRDAED